MDPGSKVTYNGVEIGRVVGIEAVDSDGVQKAQGHARRQPQVHRPDPGQRGRRDQGQHGVRQQVHRVLVAEGPRRRSGSTRPRPIDVSSVTTEFNTLFETVRRGRPAGRPDQAEPDADRHRRRRSTGSATGSASRSQNGNDDPGRHQPADAPAPPATSSGWPTWPTSTPTPRRTCSTAWSNAVTTARTLNEQQGNLDAALMAAVGFGNTGGDVFERGGPYLVRGAADLIPTSRTARRVQPRAVLHHPQLPRRRAEDRLVARRQRLLAAHRTPRCSARPTRTCTPTTCRG